MRLRLSLTTLAIAFFIFDAANAQTDSTHYDLGRIQVNKNFTQSITVKASDIERYQFNYITDALNVFFNGTFTNSSSVVYVIDGNIVNDVNAYSIQDVEEITLVQSAAAQVSGAGTAQQMVLIKTKRGGPGKQGIVASDQTSLVSARNNNNYSDATKPTGIYDQAYLGAYKNYTNADIGISLGFLHDVSPVVLPSTYTAADPFHYNQFRFNAYADTRIWKGSSLSFGVNYTPQVNNDANSIDDSTPTSQIYFNDGRHESQHLFNTNIALHSHIASGLTNTLSAGYNHYNDLAKDTTVENFTNQGTSPINTHINETWYQLASTLMIKDNLAYHQKVGDWNIDPSLNFMYRHVKDTLNVIESAYQDSVPTSIFQYGTFQKADYNLSLLTPSADIYYKNIFDIQGGFVSILNKENLGPNFPVSHLLPFVSASLNISEMAHLQTLKLKVFGSFSRQNEFLDDPYISLAIFAPQGFDNAVGTYTNTTEVIAPTGYNVFQSYNNYQAGFELGLWKNFRIAYNFRENYQGVLAEYEVPVGPNSANYEYVYQNAKTLTNSVALNYDLHSGNFNWAAGLNATESRLQLTDDPTNSYLSSGHRWTGGFTNRFAYNNLFAGLDVLYQLGQRPYSLEYSQPGGPGYIPSSNTNSFSLQNLYLGTRLKINHLKYAEIYLDTRNILQNKTSDITDERRFYGLGFKLNL